MVSAHTATAIRSHSIPKSLKNLPWNLYCNFATPNHEKITKVTPKWVPRGSQNPPQIDQNPDLEPKVSRGVSPGTPGSPKWCPRYQKWTPKWVPRGSQINQLTSQPVNQYTSQPIACRRGAGGSGRSPYIYIHIILGQPRSKPGGGAVRGHPQGSAVTRRRARSAVHRKLERRSPRSAVLRVWLLA